MSFQLPTTTNAPTGGFSFGAPSTTTPAAAPAAKAAGFSFGASGAGDASNKPAGFGFGATAAPATSTAAAPTLGLGAAGGTSFSFGAPAATAAATTTAPTAAAPTAGATAPVSTSFGFGASAPSAAATAPSAAATAQPAAPAAATAAAPATNFSFGAPAAAASTPASASSANTTALAASTAAATALTSVTSSLAAKPAAAATGFASLTTATKTTDSAAITNATQLTYNQLEEHINKWTLELEEQEKVFTDQATQINAWDKILISNNQKILDLNDAVQKVKSDQQTLEQELEFIATQHKELEESIMPLQKEFLKIPQVDVERSQTYLMVENLDTQLKQMSEDLKEIIDSLNESNKSQDNSDPIIQIGKILNAHMSSLQWIEQSTSNIGNKLDEITKMHETFKRDSERSFRSAYYN